MRIKPKGPKGLRHRLILQTFGLVGFRMFPLALRICVPRGLLINQSSPDCFRSGGKRGTVVEVEAAGQISCVASPSLVRHGFYSMVHRRSERQAKGHDRCVHGVPGLHWMRLYHANGATVARPFLVTETVEQIETEPNNRLATANSITSLPSGVQGGCTQTWRSGHFFLSS